MVRAIVDPVEKGSRRCKLGLQQLMDFMHETFREITASYTRLVCDYNGLQSRLV
jgi:hypothetical protein